MTYTKLNPQAPKASNQTLLQQSQFPPKSEFQMRFSSNPTQSNSATTISPTARPSIFPERPSNMVMSPTRNVDTYAQRPKSGSNAAPFQSTRPNNGETYASRRRPPSPTPTVSEKASELSLNTRSFSTTPTTGEQSLSYLNAKGDTFVSHSKDRAAANIYQQRGPSVMDRVGYTQDMVVGAEAFGYLVSGRANARGSLQATAQMASSIRSGFGFFAKNEFQGMGNVTSVLGGASAAANLFSGNGSVRDGFQLANTVQTGAKWFNHGSKVASNTVTSISNAFTNILGVGGGAFAGFMQATALRNAMWPDGKANQAKFITSAALGGLGTAVGAAGTVASIGTIATHGIAGAATAATSGGVSGMFSALGASLVNPWVLGGAAVLAAAMVVIGKIRAAHKKNDSSVKSIDGFTVGWQYDSNPGRKNVDPDSAQMRAKFLDGLGKLGLTEQDMYKQSTNPKTNTPEKRMEIRAKIAQMTGDFRMGICFNDMNDAAANAVRKAPANQKQAVFNAYAKEIQSYYDDIVGNPNQPKPPGQKNGNSNWGLMQTENASRSQYNWAQITLANMAKTCGVQFNAQYSGTLEKQQKEKIL